MLKISIKRIGLLTLLCSVMLLQSACRTTRNERIQWGTLGGAAVGTGVVIATGGSVLPAALAGASLGAIAGAVTE